MSTPKPVPMAQPITVSLFSSTDCVIAQLLNDNAVTTATAMGLKLDVIVIPNVKI
ncbi:hypothetical protein GCM10007984_05270 [Shewanella putrefaciens]|nr:hypothetical protein GCM10007984_05270 [Shewanella putrefaciens]